MKLFSTLSFATIASAQLGLYSSEGYLKTVLLKSYKGTSDVDLWWIETQTIFDWDTGFQWLRITHTLNTYVQSD
jgi:hypothetical protein